jgi:hypothetical protein
MSNTNQIQTGNVLSPESKSNNVGILEQVNKKNQFTIENALQKLVESTNFQFFEGKTTGNHYLVHIHETSGDPISAGRIETTYGTVAGKTLNPKPSYQRPTGQHPVKKQKSILMDFLCGERVGTVVLFKSRGIVDDIVDGGQRVSIVYNFMKDKIVLTGANASKFWAYYFRHIVSGRNQNYDEQLKLECNKIINGIITNKNIPNVKFSALPLTIKQEIRQLTFDVKRIEKINFFCLETQDDVSKDHPDYDEYKVIEMIRSKFNKLNLQQKPVQPIHTIWGSSSLYNITSRGYVESSPELMSLLGYNMIDDDDAENDETMRLFNDLIVRSMLNYDGKITWGMGLTKVTENILECVYDPSEQGDLINSKIVLENFMKKNLENIFVNTFVDNNNTERRINLAKEIVGSKQKGVMQRLFVISLFLFSDFMKEKMKYRKYFDQSELPTNRLFNYVELLSKIISLVSMRTIDESQFYDQDRPLTKYGLKNMFKTNEKTFKNLIKFGGHSQKDNSLLIPTLKEIVELVDEYTL